MKRCIHGSILIELLLSVGVWAIMLFGFMHIHRCWVSRERSIQALKLGVALSTVQGLTTPQIQNEIQTKFPHINITVKDYKDSAASRFFNLKEIRVHDRGVGTRKRVVFHQGAERW